MIIEQIKMGTAICVISFVFILNYSFLQFKISLEVGFLFTVLQKFKAKQMSSRFGLLGDRFLQR